MHTYFHTYTHLPTRSLEGILDELNNSRLVDGVALDNLRAGEDSDNDAGYRALPGELRLL